MSSLSINSVTNPYPNYGQNPYSQGQSSFQSLANAVQSGNLSAAQTAFTSLEQTLQNQSGQQGSQQSSQNNPVNTDLQNLSTALEFGQSDVCAAGVRAVAKGHADAASHGTPSPSSWRRRRRPVPSAAVVDLVFVVDVKHVEHQREQHLREHAQRHGLNGRVDRTGYGNRVRLAAVGARPSARKRHLAAEFAVAKAKDRVFTHRAGLHVKVAPQPFLRGRQLAVACAHGDPRRAQRPLQIDPVGQLPMRALQNDGTCLGESCPSGRTIAMTPSEEPVFNRLPIAVWHDRR